jgi:general secretion pathway protein K
MKSIKKERAVALLIAVSFVALLTALITDYGYETRIYFKEMNGYKKWIKATNIAISGFEGAKALLKEDIDEDRSEKNYPNIDFYVSGDELDLQQEIWSQVKKIPFEVEVGGEKGLIVGNIVDEMGKLNINSLVDNAGKESRVVKNVFIRFFDIMGAESPEEVANALIDWIDPDDEGLYESSFYSSLDRPYSPRNFLFMSLSELKLIKVINEDLKKVLFPPGNDDPLSSPYLTAFPLSTGTNAFLINVNTAPKEVLMALHINIDEEVAEEIIKKRQEEPFRTPTEFITYLRDEFNIQFESTNPQESFVQGQLRTSSTCFSILSVGVVGDISSTIRAVVIRSGGDPKEFPILYFRME